MDNEIQLSVIQRNIDRFRELLPSCGNAHERAKLLRMLAAEEDRLASLRRQADAVSPSGTPACG